MNLPREWREPQSLSVPAALCDFVGGHPLVAETLVRRGITSVDAARAFMDPCVYPPAPPDELPGVAQSVARLTQAIQQDERICVWGDFDVDGQTATSLLVAALRDLGADVIYHIPVRETESHGIKVPWLQQELDRDVRVLLSCDTGIDACEAVDFANSRGVDVVITDHHELPPTLPQAYAIVNPHLLSAGHPLETLPGVGVAYKLVEALYAWAGRPEDVAQYLDLVALGIVADVAVQTGDTRYLLQRGLEVLRDTPRLGLQALMQQAHIQPARLTEDDIGFGLAPRLNALGRLADANPIVEFFTTTDLARARILASELESLNARRKNLCDQVLASAQAQIEQHPELLKHAALVLSQPAWPPGVIGIVANRLVERYQRPVVLIATPADGLGRGSARSISGVHITDAIAGQADLLASFGGHEMAAGLSLEAERIPAFRRALSEAVADQMRVLEEVPALELDGFVSLGDLSMELVEDLNRLAPFGAGNPHPLLASRNLTLIAQRTLGRDGKHVLLTVEDEAGAVQDVVWWHWNNAALPEGKFDLAYTLRINEFRGTRRLQVVWEDMRPSVEAVVSPEVEKPDIELIDYRHEPRPQILLQPLLTREDVQIWREGVQALDKPGRRRDKLQPATTLVIWTAPPGPEELRQALELVSPHTVYIFLHAPEGGDVAAFLKNLTGLVKYALSARDGRLNCAALAGMLAQREVTVHAGLAWLVAQGHIAVLDEEEGETVHVGPGDQIAKPSASESLAQLRVLLEEASAYRAYIARAETESLREILKS